MSRPRSEMGHLDEGTLHACLDGELDPAAEASAQRHLEECAECAERFREAAGASRFVSDALEVLGPPHATDEHRWEVRRSWARRRSGAHRRRLSAAAAVLVLFAGGALSAHPSSPVRGWVASVWGGDEPAVATVQTEESERSGVASELRDGRVVVELRSVPSGTEVRVRMVEGSRASLDVVGEALYSTAPGRLMAEVRSGRVEVSVPSGAAEASVEANGRTLLRIRNGEVDLPGPVPEEAGAGEVRFLLAGDAR